MIHRHQWRFILDTILLGVVGALSAQLFNYMLDASQYFFMNYLAGYTPLTLSESGEIISPVMGHYGMWLIPVVTTIGGLISGAIIYTIAPETEGHGTDTAVRAFHHAKGYIRPIVAPVKTIASVITLGSGGSAGREGPTALIAAGTGSIYANLVNRSEEEKRLIMLVGMASGLSAIFRSPIGTAIFAVEVLYSDMDFEGSALLYTMIGSVVAYAVNGLFVGWQPLFHVPAGLEINQFSDYFLYIILGVGSGIIASILPNVFYGLRDVFHSFTKLPNHVKPAIGGFGVGIIAIMLPQVLGGGYGWIQQAINGNIATSVLLILVFAKMAAFSLTVSSGGSGGVFAPSLFVGSMLGGFFARIFDQPSAAFVVVGMAAVFGGAARIPIATLLMVVEMTGGYTLLVPAALAVMLSYLVQTQITKRFKYKSLYEAQLPNESDSPAHHIQHLQTVLRLLGERKIDVPSYVNHVDLYSVLSAGIPVDVSGGKQLIIGVLREESKYVGKPVGSGYLNGQNNNGDSEEAEVIGIFRDGNLVLPHPDTVLKKGDQLMLITSSDARKWLKTHVRPLAENDKYKNGDK